LKGCRQKNEKRIKARCIPKYPHGTRASPSRISQTSKSPFYRQTSLLSATKCVEIKWLVCKYNLGGSNVPSTPDHLRSLRDQDMKRKEYIDYIKDKLALLAVSIKTNGKLNLLELNIHAETFFAGLFNVFFDLKLNNINETEQNADGIDLVDNINKEVFQVTATNTKTKINHSLGRNLTKYANYHFRFVVIVPDASDLKNNTYENPHNLLFDPKRDIYANADLLRILMGKTDIIEIKKVYDYFINEFEGPRDKEDYFSHISAIISILSEGRLSETNHEQSVSVFEIEEKIKFNSIQRVACIIRDLAVFSPKLDAIYSEFSKAGKNTSCFVLNKIRSFYIELVSCKNSDEKFMTIIDRVHDLVLNSTNCPKIACEELEYCIQIVIVDAFIRCKIFEHPAINN
jgi:hypothetical protein